MTNIVMKTHAAGPGDGKTPFILNKGDVVQCPEDVLATAWINAGFAVVQDVRNPAHNAPVAKRIVRPGGVGSFFSGVTH